MRRPIRPIAALLLIGTWLVAAPSVAAGDPCYHSYTFPPPTSGQTSTVQLDACAFLPTVTRVAPGTTVRFANTSEFVHVLSGANQEWGDRDREIPVGATVTYTFNKVGVYPFSCALHRGMSGAVIVGALTSSEADAAPAGSTTAASDSSSMVAVAGLGTVGLLGWAAAALAWRRTRADRLATGDEVKPLV
jgi:plastocyanin